MQKEKITKAIIGHFAYGDYNVLEIFGGLP
jgi:hypothetical protein